MKKRNEMKKETPIQGNLRGRPNWERLQRSHEVLMPTRVK